MNRRHQNSNQENTEETSHSRVHSRNSSFNSTADLESGEIGDFSQSRASSVPLETLKDTSNDSTAFTFEPPKITPGKFDLRMLIMSKRRQEREDEVFDESDDDAEYDSQGRKRKLPDLRYLISHGQADTYAYDSRSTSGKRY
jgi:hypothetical protein